MDIVGSPPSATALVIDAHLWPILQCTYPNTTTHQDIDLFVASLALHFERARSTHTHLGTVADLRPVRFELTTSEIRQYLAEALATIDKRFPGVAVCDAVVATSPLLRLAITAHSRLRMRRNHITRCFANVHEATNWAHLTLRSSTKQAIAV